MKMPMKKEDKAKMPKSPMKKYKKDKKGKMPMKKDCPCK
jgi:hypothetical protein